jgi:hypothetical protein
VKFVKDKLVNAIVFGEALDRFLFMFINAAREIAGHADIQRSIPLTCEDVNARTFLDHAELPGSPLSRGKRSIY